jgi:DNA (cytosine-5)-methyltransferase 1
MKDPGQKLLLSLFPGADLFGRAFEAEGFCVVRGPDPLWGGDIREFKCVAGHFWGVFGGSPCQDFSKLRRCPPTGHGVAMLAEFARCVTEAQPEWALLENVPGVQDLPIAGYFRQRFNLAAKECGAAQSRLRCFQWFNRVNSTPLVIHRGAAPPGLSRAALASEGRRQGRRSWADFCELQGLPRNFALPGLSQAARYQAVGNGVPIQMGRVLARAILAWSVTDGLVRVCICGCGRPLPGSGVHATPSCRKRMERARDAAGVTKPGPVTPGPSQLSLV